MAELSLTEKILKERIGHAPPPGEHVIVEVDYVYMHDGTFPLALQAIQELGGEDGVKREKVILFIDHAAPAPNLVAAQVHHTMRLFSRRHGIRLYDVGTGISHQVMVEEGFARPGRIIVGADSHTVTLGALAALATGVGSTDAALAALTGKLWIRVPEQVKVVLAGTPAHYVSGKDIALELIRLVGENGAIYKSLEFTGNLSLLPLSSRLTISNMVVEAGAKFGLFPCDKLLEQEAGVNCSKLYTPDINAEYSDEIIVELSTLEPLVSVPPRVGDVRSVREVEGVEVDQVFIGGCTGGRYEDFVAAAQILKGRRVRDGVRCIAIPATRRIMLRLTRDGIVEKLVEAGCVVTYGTCGPCLGAHFGLLGEDEVAVSTTNRNMTGRMGHRTSRVYLASALTAAAAAVAGRIVDPRELLRGEVGVRP